MAVGLGCQQLGMILPLLVKPKCWGSSRGALWEVCMEVLSGGPKPPFTNKLQFNRMSEFEGDLISH